MKELLTSLTTKGQVTLPLEVRHHLGVKPKDKVAFIIEEDGSVRVSAPKYPDIASVSGAAGRLATPRSWQEMRDIAREERTTEKHGRTI